MLFGTLAITLIYIVFLRCFVGCIVYLSIVALVLCAFAFTGWNIWKYTQLAAIASPDA